jgi:hypothetical protein
MQDISASLTAVVFLALIALLVAAVAVPVENAGTLQAVRAVPLGGKIMVIQETPHMILTTHEVQEDSRFRSTRDSAGPLVIPAQSRRHPPAERVINAVTTRVLTADVTLPVDQLMPVQVADAEGNAVCQRAATSALKNARSTGAPSMPVFVRVKAKAGIRRSSALSIKLE